MEPLYLVRVSKINFSYEGRLDEGFISNQGPHMNETSKGRGSTSKV